jgi:hypothetical protein
MRHQVGKGSRGRLSRSMRTFLGSALLPCMLVASLAQGAASPDLSSVYRFLVSDRTQGGILYSATAGSLRGLALPLSFYDSPDYWAVHVCTELRNPCAVTDHYNPADYSLRPEKNAAGALQTERVNVHNGSNIYDAATWQIAVTLGQVRHGFTNPQQIDGYALASHQNKLLEASHDGNAANPVPGANRAVTRDGVFTYGGQVLRNPAMAYSFRMVARRWLADDPLMGSPHAHLIRARNLPPANPDYRAGRISWTDWKPITGENAWAFLLGPLHSARLHYLERRKERFIPFEELALRNALGVLPAFAALQSPLGGVYYAPAGTISNMEEVPVNPHFVAVENNFSLYAGLRLLDSTLAAIASNQQGLSRADQQTLATARETIDAMLNGGAVNGKVTAGLKSFLRNQAWQDGEFMQGGLANDPSQSGSWMPALDTKAVDVNTWGVAALGARQIDEWFGFGAAFRNWQGTKAWGGYGVGETLWGVGFSNHDGNGMAEDGTYRQGVLSAEWTAGAVAMVRNMIAHYASVTEPRNAAPAREYVTQLQADERAMLQALQRLRIDRYAGTGFPGRPDNFSSLLKQQHLPYLYASRRYLIPFGWYANPLPSTSSTAWMIMLESGFDPFSVPD